MLVFLTICTMLCKVHLITVYKSLRAYSFGMDWM